MPSLAPGALAVRSLAVRSLAVALALLAGAAGCSQVDQPGAPTVETARVAPPTGGVTATTGLTTTSEPDLSAPDGVVVWAQDREPPDLQVDDPANGTDVAGWVQQGLVEGLFGVAADLSYYPELLAGQPQLTRSNTGKLIIAYTLREGLRWSDGTQLTANDVAYTDGVIRQGCETEADGSIVDGSAKGCEYAMASRIGYDLVTNLTVTSPLTFTITLAAFFAGWRGLYDRVFAEHAFGVDAFEVNQNLRQWRSGAGVLPSSGPMVLKEWVPGRRLDLARNERYHGSVSPDARNRGLAGVAGVRIVFVSDAVTRAGLLGEGRAQLTMTPLDPALGPVAGAGKFVVASRPGGQFEHLGMNVLNPHLARPQVREAIALALNKAEIVAQVYQPILGSLVPAGGLGSTYFVPGQLGYTDHQARYGTGDVAGAAADLTAAGYVQGPDGIWAHPAAGRLALRATTTSGNPLRDQQLTVIRAQLARAGIEVTIENLPGGLFFDQGPFSPEALQASASGGSAGDPHRWDLALWSWTAGPWPGALSGIYKKQSTSNPYGFADPAFDSAAVKCEAVVADDERVACYNDLDTYATTLDHGPGGLFVVPLSQKPRYYGYDSQILSSAPVAPDVVEGGPLVNAGDLVLAS